MIFAPNLLLSPRRTVAAPTATQTLAFYYWTAHYVKRILETLFVHNFSRATMPLLNLFKNTSYYAGAAAIVGFTINAPGYADPGLFPDQTSICLGVAAFFQLLNFWTHLQLANMRKPGETGYKIPRGLLFRFVCCPNYTTEIYAWLAFALGTQSIAALGFACVGAAQMIEWAFIKYKRLRGLFGPSYPKRYVILPPVL